MKKTFVPTFLLLFSIFCLNAQNDKKPFCTADDIKHYKSLPSSKLRSEQVEASVPDTAKLVRIPVVFNIVNLGEKVGDSTNVSAEVIKTNLELLNDYYRNRIIKGNISNSFYYNPKGIDTKVEFYLADLDSTCNYSTGIRRYNGSTLPRYKDIGITYNNTSDGFNNDYVIKKASGTYTKRYLNIWIVNTIFSNSSVIGYAYYPQSYEFAEGIFGIVATWSNISGVLIHEVGHFLGLTHDDMAVDGLNGLHAFKIIRQSANYYSKQLLTKPFTCTPKTQTDVGLKEITGFVRAQCATTVQPKIKIKNYGSAAIQTCKIKLVENNQTLQDYTWTGNLTSLDTIWANLPVLTLSAGSHNIQVVAYSVNNTTDALRTNDSLKVKTLIVKTINTFPWANNLDNDYTPITLSSGEKSNVSWLTGIGLNQTSALLFEGKDHESRNGVVPDGSFDGFNPFGKHNINFHAYADVCINTAANKHYKIKFRRYQDSWGVSHFRTLSNNNQTQTSTAGRFSEWFSDSTVVSSDNNTSILLSFQSACDYGYATKTRYGYGDFIIVDNLNIAEIQPSAFKFDFMASPSNKGCAPLNASVVNKSFGAPLPILYKFYVSKNGVLLDSTITIDTRKMYVPANESAVYDMKVVAVFKDGKTSTLNFPSFVNTTNTIINTTFSENFENQLSIKLDNNSTFKNLDWQIANIGANGNSNKSIMINQVGQNSGWKGLKVSLVAGPYDFSGFNNGFSVRYDRAYAAPFLSTATDEYLSIEYSLDCGKTWKETVKTTGDKLVTTAYNSNYYFNLFTPKNNEWATDFFDIDTIAGKKDVLIKFAFHPEFGNSIYLDNIMFGNKSTVGLEQGNLETALSYSVFPNPSNSTITIVSELPVEQVKVYDLFGAQVLETQSATFNIEKLSAGLYSGTILNSKGELNFFKFIKIDK